MGRLVTALLPGSLVAWKPPIPDLPVSEPQWAPRPECICSGEGGRKEGGQNQPWLPCPAAFTHRALPPSPCHALCHPFRGSSGSEWFSPCPTPTQVGRGAGQGPGPPITPLTPKPPCFLCPGVCSLPPLCLSSRPPRSSPCPPCSLLHWPPTNLSWPLSPSPSSHLLLTGMSLGQRQAPSPPPLPLCALVSLSLSVL